VIKILEIPALVASQAILRSPMAREIAQKLIDRIAGKDLSDPEVPKLVDAAIQEIEQSDPKTANQLWTLDEDIRFKVLKSVTEVDRDLAVAVLQMQVADTALQRQLSASENALDRQLDVANRTLTDLRSGRNGSCSRP
jgi:hypothetical protein